MLRLSLWLSAAPHRRQLCLARHPPLDLLRDHYVLGPGQQGTAFCKGEAQLGKTAVAPLENGQRHRTVRCVADVGGLSDSSLNDQAHGLPPTVR